MYRDGTVTVPLANPDFFFLKIHNIFDTGLVRICVGKQIKNKSRKNQGEGQNVQPQNGKYFFRLQMPYQ